MRSGRDSKIGDGIKECTSELDTALAKFQVCSRSSRCGEALTLP